MIIFAWICAALALVALGGVLFNLVFWPRGRADGRAPARISVLIPARNEEDSIERCIRAVANAGDDVLEIIVCDDRSTDATPDILARLKEELGGVLKTFVGPPLPDGWIGKPHACAQLAARARGDVLLYIDADTALEEGALSRLGSLFENCGAHLVTAVPRQDTESFFERLIVPLLHVTYASWLPMPLVWLSKDLRFLAANGQFLAVRRETYDAVGGFESVRADIVDDMAFCRRVKASGFRVVFADGFHLSRCRMYRDGQGVWEGFSKNIYEGIGGRPWNLAAVLGLFSATFIVPYVLLVAALVAPAQGLLLPALIGVGANVLLRGVLAVRHRQSALGIALHPLGVVGLMAIAVNSMIWTRAGRLKWAGRVYQSRDQRASALQEV